MLEDLERDKTKLEQRFLRDYAPRLPAPSAVPLVSSGPPARTHASYEFLGRYRTQRTKSALDELQEYLRLQPEPWNDGDPAQAVEWWGGAGRARFPNLARMARDILSMPGELTLHIFCFYVHCAHASHPSYRLSRVRGASLFRRSSYCIAP